MSVGCEAIDVSIQKRKGDELYETKADSSSNAADSEAKFFIILVSRKLDQCSLFLEHKNIMKTRSIQFRLVRKCIWLQRFESSVCHLMVFNLVKRWSDFGVSFY